MAKKTTPELTWREILTGIRKGTPAPVYILMGEEAYFIDLIVDALEKEVIAEEDRDFNQTVLYGAETDVETVVTTAQQYPFMAERRLVILKEGQAMDRAKSQLDKLEGYVSHPNPTTTLAIVFKGDNLTATSRLLKAAAKSGAVVFKSKPVKDYQLAGPIRDYCQSKRVSIDDRASEMLVAFVGNSLSKLFSEIDKLLIGAGPGCQRITLEMVEENIGVSKEFNNFELVKAVSVRDYAKAMTIVENFASNPKANPLVLTISMLFRFFSSLCIAHFNPDKSDQALMGVLQLKNVYALQEIKTGMRMYNAKQTVECISALRDTDCRSKGIDANQNDYALLRELIFRFFTV